MKTFLDADPRQKNQINKILNEIYTGISRNSSISLVHDVYFGGSLSITDTSGSETALVRNVDYEWEDKDDNASKLSNKDCYKKIHFLKNFNSLKISYHAYGDYVKASDMNLIFSRLDASTTPTISEFSPSSTYKQDNLVWKDGILYKALNDMAAGSWESSKWVIVIDSPIQKEYRYGNGVLTVFTVSGLSATAHNFEFSLNGLPLDSVDYAWSVSGTLGTLKIITFVPLPGDRIDIVYRK
jgi:hypothetical protein